MWFMFGSSWLKYLSPETSCPDGTFFCDFSYSPEAYSRVAPNLNCSEHDHCVVPYDGELTELLRQNNHPNS